jgi:hypothetical protein
MTVEEIERLGILVSEVDRPMQPLLPRYATDIIPPGLTEEEALDRALQNSAPHRRRLYLVRSTRGLLHLHLHHRRHFLSAANWPWQIPDFIMLDDDGE